MKQISQLSDAFMSNRIDPILSIGSPEKKRTHSFTFMVTLLCIVAPKSDLSDGWR